MENLWVNPAGGAQSFPLNRLAGGEGVAAPSPPQEPHPSPVQVFGLGPKMKNPMLSLGAVEHKPTVFI